MGSTSQAMSAIGVFLLASILLGLGVAVHETSVDHQKKYMPNKEKLLLIERQSGDHNETYVKFETEAATIQYDERRVCMADVSRIYTGEAIDFYRNSNNEFCFQIPPDAIYYVSYRGIVHVLPNIKRKKP